MDCFPVKHESLTLKRCASLRHTANAENRDNLSDEQKKLKLFVFIRTMGLCWGAAAGNGACRFFSSTD
ncbi:hypothetical protein CBW22_23780 [Pantoea sp. VS1]|nr:hypothetical protein CBW22_23780 [Pantoea sp. VS1]